MRGRSSTNINVQGRELVRVGYDVDVPLIGSIAFGLIDRGTNIIQVRPVSFCALSCIFCSTDAGPRSRWRRAEYYVAHDMLIDWVNALAKLKGRHLEAHIDTVGDPLLYDKLPDLIHELKTIPEVEVVSLQTHGLTLTYKLVDKLSSSGLDRVNLSIDTLDEDKGRYLQGARYYSVRRVMEYAEYIVRSTSTDITLTPVYLPGINDSDINDMVRWGIRIGVGRRSPPFGIQKFVKHKHGRVPKGVKIISWGRFYSFLRRLEKRFSVKLVLSKRDYGVKEAPTPPLLFRVGDKVRVEVVAPGWLKNEWLAIPTQLPNRVITIIGEGLSVGMKLAVRVFRNKHNIYLARPIH
ncbi:MAG: hypothetical protein B6U73_01385 [Desulfurococcales archaeon ex4484_204]|nr:MAG: hypothetical protein B6U73_01385 [Desulfurococcales archaeon ex4484_204]